MGAMSLENVTSPLITGASSACNAEDNIMETAAGATKANPILNCQRDLREFIASLLGAQLSACYNSLHRNRLLVMRSRGSLGDFPGDLGVPEPLEWLLTD